DTIESTDDARPEEYTRARGNTRRHDRRVSFCSTKALEPFVMEEGLVVPRSVAVPASLAELPRIEEAYQHRDFGECDIGPYHGDQQIQKRCMTDSYLQGVHRLTSLRSVRSSPSLAQDLCQSCFAESMRVSRVDQSRDSAEKAVDGQEGTDYLTRGTWRRMVIARVFDYLRWRRPSEVCRPNVMRRDSHHSTQRRLGRSDYSAITIRLPSGSATMLS